jgi:hypothetical protein
MSVQRHDIDYGENMLPVVEICGIIAAVQGERDDKAGEERYSWLHSSSSGCYVWIFESTIILPPLPFSHNSFYLAATISMEYAKFLEVWSEADEGSRQPVHAQKRLAELRVAAKNREGS